MDDKTLEDTIKLINEYELGDKGEHLKELIQMRERINDIIESLILSFSIR